MPRWFLIINGVALLLMGVALLVGRLRQQDPWHSPGRFLGFVWALLCCVVGAGLLLMSTGHLPQPGAGAPQQARPRAPVFPTDR